MNCQIDVHQTLVATPGHGAVSADIIDKICLLSRDVPENRGEIINLIGACHEKIIMDRVVLCSSSDFLNDFDIVLKIAEFYCSVEDEEVATAFYNRAKEIRIDNAWSYVHHGRFLAKNGQFKAAENVLAQGLSFVKVAASGADIVEILQRDYIRFSCFARRADFRYGEMIGRRQFFQGRPIENALFVAMVKNEEDIIFECLRSAYDTGFRNYFIANNGSTDQTLNEIQRFITQFQDAVVVVMADPIVGYWQDRKMNEFWRFSVKYFDISGTKIDWVFPVDADELIVQAVEGQDLYGLLKSSRADQANLLYGMWCNATADGVFDDWAAPHDINKSFPIVSGYEDDFDAQAKVAFRAIATAELRMGAHFAGGCITDASSTLSLNDWGIFLIHHPIRSRNQFRSKIINGMKALNAAPTLGAGQGNHWRANYDYYLNEGEAFINRALSDICAKNRACAAQFARQSAQWVAPNGVAAETARVNCES